MPTHISAYNIVNPKDENGRAKQPEPAVNGSYIKDIHTTTEELGMKKTKKCSVQGCSNPATDGGHVGDRRNASPKDQYLVPLCHECNTAKKGELRLRHDTLPVPVNIKERTRLKRLADRLEEGIKICRKDDCDKPAKDGNYGFCGYHRRK
jgi:hypothetical protein